jgi:hypothetical protein
MYAVTLVKYQNTAVCVGLRFRMNTANILPVSEATDLLTFSAPHTLYIVAMSLEESHQVLKLCDKYGYKSIPESKSIFRIVKQSLGGNQ